MTSTRATPFTEESTKSSGGASINSDETSIGINFPEGVVGGVEATTATDSLENFLSALGNAIVSDVSNIIQDAQTVATCGIGGCAPPPEESK